MALGLELRQKHTVFHSATARLVLASVSARGVRAVKFQPYRVAPPASISTEMWSAAETALPRLPFFSSVRFVFGLSQIEDSAPAEVH